jgi:hypothetical protein
MTLQHLLNVLVQIANKVGGKKRNWAGVHFNLGSVSEETVIMNFIERFSLELVFSGK